jgi:hypothetical protein
MAVNASDIKEHMEVQGSDDVHVGTVDRVEGDQIKLTKTDPKSDGHHHYVSLSDVQAVRNGKVVLSKPANQASQSAAGAEVEGARGVRPGSPKAGP